MKVQHSARLHERSVQAIARGEKKRMRKSPSPLQSKNSEVTTTGPRDPLIEQYLDAIGVDKRRVQTLSPTEIIIHNSGQWKRRK